MSFADFALAIILASGGFVLGVFYGAFKVVKMSNITINVKRENGGEHGHG